MGENIGAANEATPEEDYLQPHAVFLQFGSSALMRRVRPRCLLPTRSRVLHRPRPPRGAALLVLLHFLDAEMLCMCVRLNLTSYSKSYTAVPE
jgi:hypothetical protein